MFKTSWTILAKILGISAILKCRWFFQILSMTPWNTGQKNIFKKIAPKHVWTLGNVFGQFQNIETFLIFSFNFFNVSTSNFKSGKPNSNFLSPENWPHIFKSRKSEKPCMEHLAKKLGKIASKHVQNTFGHFWRRIWSIWNFENFLIFFEIFLNPTLHGTRGIFFRKKCHKTCSKQVWTILGTILGFSAILNFLWFSCENFRWLHGTLGKKFFSKKSPQNTFRHLGTILDNFRTLNFSSLFPWNFFKSLPQNLSPENRTQFFNSWKLISYF